MKKIIRSQYMDELAQLKNTPDIKVITGIRRSGKSELIKDFIQNIQSNEPLSNIIFINLQDLEYEHLKEYHNLNSYILNHYKESTLNYLIIDEVQLCPNFELVINSLHSKNMFDIYITGSNAFLLSSDLATLFTGRAMEIEVFPFSYKEYLNYYNLDASDDAFDQYVSLGGMSGSYVYDNLQKKYAYLSDIYKTIILRDLITKYKIRDIELLEKLSDFMIDNIGNLSSTNNISNELKSLSPSHNTVSNYILYLCNAFLFYKARRYDLKGRKYLKTTEKYYLVDHSFKYALLGSRNMDYGRTYENIIYIELLRRGYDVYIGKLYEKEIDFVATRQHEKLYIQVSDDISKESTLTREVTPLLSIKDAYPKIIIARTKHPMYQYEGVQIYDISDWLSQ